MSYNPSRHPSRAAGLTGRAPMVLAVGGLLFMVGYVLTHDDPSPGLSARGWFTLALAAIMLIALRAHRRPLRSRAPLTRAVAEYATVALLVVLLVAPPATTPAKVSARTPPAAPDRPVLVGVVTGVGDFFAELKRQVELGTAAPPSTTTPRR